MLDFNFPNFEIIRLQELFYTALYSQNNLSAYQARRSTVKYSSNFVFHFILRPRAGR